MANVVALALVLIILACLAALVVWSVRKYGWPGTLRNIQLFPIRLYRRVFAPSARSGSRKRAMTTTSVEQMDFQRLTDPVHKFTLLYPSHWTVARSDTPSASIVVQITCDSNEESYKRLSVAWDDVSWSSVTAEKFARGVVDQLSSLVSGSELVSHGPHQPGRRSDGAYEIVYTVTDPVDGSKLQLLNVVVVSSHAGQRRAYTITFGCDSEAFHAALPLARHMIDSFSMDALSAGPPAPSGTERDEVHVNVWERERSRLLGEEAQGGTSNRATVSATGSVADTPSDASAVSWARGSITQASLSYIYPSNWQCSGLGHDESLGFSPIAVHSVRRWCIAHTCDRRETSFKHVSVVCVDVTPCYDIVMARIAKNPKALEGSDAGTLLLTYLAYRYKLELAEAAALAAARAPSHPPLSGSEEMLKSWIELFGQRWPPTCKVSTPESPSNSAQVVAPFQAEVLDIRVLGQSRLLKVRGGLRSAARVEPTNGHHSASPTRGKDGRRSSTYSSLSLEHESSAVEGILIDTTSAVLVGLHDAVVATGNAKVKGTSSNLMQNECSAT
jgi:hypothetical protein